LLNQLLTRSLDLGEETDLPLYTILESYLSEAIEPELIQAAIEDAQVRFNQHGGAYAQAHELFLEAFSRLLQHAGSLCDEFAEHLWRAYIFQAHSAAEALWELYPGIQQAVALNTGESLPLSWGEWILLVQSFMSLVEQCLVERIDVFRDLLTFDDLLDLVEALPSGEGEEFSVYQPSPEPVLVGGQFDQGTLTAYLTCCANHIGRIDARGYPGSTDTTVPISDVYVPLRLVPLAEYARAGDYTRYAILQYNDPDPYTFYPPFSIPAGEPRSDMGIADILSQYPLAVILGQTGAGKTMLLRFLVLEYARVLMETQTAAAGEGRSAGSFNLSRPLPVYIDLATFVEHREDEETLENFILRTYSTLTQDEDTGPLLRTMIRDGRCLMLLDGLDQVAADEQRRMLTQSVNEAAAEWHSTGNRVVVSSRFSAYAVSPLAPEFEALVLRPLERSQISRFLLQWKLALELRQRPLRDKDEALRQAHQQTLNLARQIGTSPRLYALVNTPLLLKMLVSVYQPGMILVPQSVAIYQLVADSLIREWRLPQVPQSQPCVLEHEATPLLGELAAWLQASRPTGVVGEDELRRILQRIWLRMHPDATTSQASRAVGMFLGILRLHAGVFIELAPQRYGFIYQGLQEYFAARYLVSSSRQAPIRLREYLHDPRWDEIIALAIAFVSRRSSDDASDLIETAVLARGERAGELFGNAASLFESILKRDLFFAARLLGEGIDVRHDVMTTIVRQLMTLWLDGEGYSLGRFNAIFDSARRYLVALEGTSASRIALQIAQDNLAAPKEHTQAFAVDALTFWPSHFAEAQRIITDQGHHLPLLVRRAVAAAFSHIGPLIRDAYGALIMLTTDPDDQVCQLSQRTLASVPPPPHETLRLWIEFLHSDDPVHRRVSLRRLRQIGALPLDIIAELLRLLDDPDESIRQRTLETLASVPNLPDDSLTVICRVIADSPPSFRATAIQAFARPVELPPLIIEQLFRWADDPDGNVREAAVRALGSCLNKDQAIVDVLIERLNDPSDRIRAAAVEPIILKGQQHPYALHMLASHAAADTFYQVRMAVAAALRHIPEPDEELQEALYALLCDREMVVRETTLETLRCIHAPGDRIIDYLVSLVGVGMPEHAITRSAVRTLAAQRGLSDDALLALVQLLRAYGEDIGNEIVTCLQAHVPLSHEIVEQLMDLAVIQAVGSYQARLPAAGLRAQAIRALGRTLDEAPGALRILLEAAGEAQNVRVRVAALESLACTRLASRHVMQELLRALEKCNTLEVRIAAGIAVGTLIHNLPDPPLEGNEMLNIARELADVLNSLPARASWEPDTRVQNQVWRALNWVVARARPTLPRLVARSEDTHSYFDE
jgi:HEAT repeat protein